MCLCRQNLISLACRLSSALVKNWTGIKDAIYWPLHIEEPRHIFLAWGKSSIHPDFHCPLSVRKLTGSYTPSTFSGRGQLSRTSSLGLCIKSLAIQQSRNALENGHSLRVEFPRKSASRLDCKCRLLNLCTAKWSGILSRLSTLVCQWMQVLRGLVRPAVQETKDTEVTGRCQWDHLNLIHNSTIRDISPGLQSIVGKNVLRELRNNRLPVIQAMPLGREKAWSELGV